MGLQEKNIQCFDCSNSFVFSIAEQEDFLSKGRNNAPKRCPSCREARKERQNRNGSLKPIQPGFKSDLKLHSAVCATCGQETRVPFEPQPGRPVYCRVCYQSVRTTR
jgi:CxxC-x17-CxxC domain-containing protein